MQAREYSPVDITSHDFWSQSFAVRDETFAPFKGGTKPDPNFSICRVSPQRIVFAASPGWRRLAGRLEDVRDDRLIGNAAPRCVWLLSAGAGQSIHRFNRAKDVHVGDAFAFGISAWLYVRPCKDGDDPVLNVM